MDKQKKAFEYCDQFVTAFEEVLKKTNKDKHEKYFVGVDIGTACIVITVLDEKKKPVAGAYRWASVVKDGMVVDYIGALKIVRELKEEIEKELGQELIYAATAIPPGTMYLDGGVVKNVVEGAGFEVTEVFDEPIAANAVLQIQDGAIVDIGGGTTGISIFKDGKVVHVADEATGGVHFSLILAGAYNMSLDKAESYKRNKKNQKEIRPVLKPAMEKVASIIEKCIQGYDVEEIYLVGGTSCLEGIDEVIEKYLKVPTFKPKNPLFVTPLGIALSSTEGTMRDGTN